MVKIYTKQGCSQCVTTINWLEQNGHEYEEVALETEEELDEMREIMHAEGIMSFPYIEVEGEKPFGGLNLKRLSVYLNRK